MKNEIMNLLTNIILPGGDDLISANIVSAIVEKDNQVGFVINLREKDAPYALELQEKCEKIITENSKIAKVNVVLTSAEVNPDSLSKSKNLIKLRPGKVKKIIMVVSCKGGVGKSTTTYLLAKALCEKYKVGILDADIYGPSMPTLFETYEQPKIENNYMIPFCVDKIKFNSIGNLVSQDNATIWRGPMVTKTLHQLLYKTKWDELDYLLVDMPPGTGDVALSMCENYAIDSAILVSIPGKLSFADNKKTIDMLEKLGVKTSLIVENMCASGGRENHLGRSYLPELKELAKCTSSIGIPINHDIYNYKLPDFSF